MKIFRNTKDDPGKEISEPEEVDKSGAAPMWMKLFHVPSEPVWFTTVTVLNYIAVVGQLYLSVNRKCVDLMKVSAIFYLLDIFYICDIVLILGSKYIRNLDLPEINLSMRPLSMLIVEIISVLPLELITTDDNLGCILHINRCIRIVRILHIFRQYRNLLDSKLFMQIVEMFSNMLFIAMITYAIYCNIMCTRSVCGVTHDCYKEKALIMISTKITLSGICRYPPYEIYFEFLTMLAGLISFFFVVAITLVMIMIGIVNITHHQIAFEDKYTATMHTLEVLDIPDYLKKSTMDVYNTFWVNCGGYNENDDFLEVLPKALRNGVMVDVYWPSLQHSKLFRAMDLPFLRYVSLYVKRIFMMPGDFVYRKNDWKNKMIYLVSGTIQLLSEEDGESPILSFTSGTCLGTSTLVVSYKSINSVRCKTFCEFHVLNKSDFIRIFKRYPRHIKNMIHIIGDRFQHAKQCNDLANHAKKKLNDRERQIDVYTIFWLKNNLHKLMVRDAETLYKHEFQNIYLLNEINENNFSRLLFTAYFLDTLTISDRTETDTDTVFARSHFPCILQPNSILIILWETVIICFTVSISFIIPHEAFVSREAPEWYTLFLYMCTLVFWCDIYVQISTGIKTKQGITKKIRLITIARMQTLGFWADMFSCMPCEIFSPVVLDTLTSQKRCMLHMNRIVKLWRVERLFRLWENKFNANMILIRFIKFSWINTYTAFVLYCYFHKTKVIYYDSILFSAVQITTGMGILDADFTMEDAMTTFADSTTTLINLMMYAYIGSACVLHGLRLLEVQQLCKCLAVKIRFRNLSPSFTQRIINYVETQLLENGCEQIKHSRSNLLNLSEMCYSETIENMIGRTLQSMPLLQDIANEVILDMCSKLHLISLPPNEVVTYAGDLVNDIFIYYKGTCEILDRTGQTERLSKSDTHNVLENVFKVPSLNSIITKTHCRFFVLPYTSFIQILTKYPNELKCLTDVVAKCGDIKREYLVHCSQPFKNMKYTTETIEHWINFFSYHLIIDSYEEYDYYVPFDHLYPFAFIRYLLLRITFMPHGKLICVWECFRCTFAILSCILNFTLPLVDTHFKYVLLALHFTALVDIYFRMHVCYYNENGVLVKHPLKTAIHYLTHGFLVDFLASIPFGIWTVAKDSKSYIVLHLNILLQLHRYFQFLNYLQINTLMPNKKWHSLTYIPVVFILCNLLGCVLIGVECQYNWKDIQHNENFTAGIKCPADALLSVSNFAKPINPFRAHFYGIYVVTSMITTVGMQGWNHGNHFTRTVIMILPVIGLYLSVAISAKIFQMYSFRSNALIHYQEAMHSLTVFLRKHNVCRKLSGSIIEHYELQWTRLKGTYMYDLIKPFTHSMRLDIMFDLICNSMYINSPFESRNLNFYRNISPYLEYELISKGGYIITINDICSSLYLVMSGVVDILAADGTKLDTLYTGSMFGNLDNLKWTRQMVSVVASCHAEIISIKATIFHKLLSHDENCKQEFRLLKAKYMSYIPSTKSKIQYTLEQSITIKLSTPTYFLNVLNPNTKSMQVWNAINLIISCYLGILLDFYQLGAGDFSSIIIILQYTSDLVYTLHVLTKRYTAYVDDYGYLIVNLQMIRKKTEENKLKFWITMISLIPADVCALVSRMDENTSHLLYSMLRLNRVLRLTYIFEYFQSSSKKLNINLGVLRFGYILIWSSLALNAMCAIMGIVSCTLEVNMQPHIQSCNDLYKLPPVEKFKLYVHYIYFVANCITLTSQHVYYPQGLWHIILCICFMFIGQYIRISIISQIFSFLNETTLQKFKFKTLLERVMYFLQNEDVSASMIKTVTAYINLIWIQQKGVIFPNLLSEAPLYLLDAIYNNAFSHLLVNHAIFLNCHPDCLRQIVQKFEYRTYFVGNYVQFKGSIDDTMYFIYEGEVAIMKEEYSKNDGLIVKLHDGESFGVKQGLYYKTPHIFTYRCLKRSIILSLCIDDWAYLLDFFPASKEQMYKLARTYHGI